MKREVSSLRELMEERRREMGILNWREAEAGRREDARSISTVMPHELEQVDEEDEEQTVEEEWRELADLEEAKALNEDEIQVQDAADDLAIETSAKSHAEAQAAAEVEALAEAEEEERGREDFNVCRPRTPEPTHMGMRGDEDPYPTRPSLLGAPRRSLLSSPLTSTIASAATVTSPTSSSSSPPEDVYEQVQKLPKQISTVMALTRRCCGQRRRRWRRVW